MQDKIHGTSGEVEKILKQLASERGINAEPSENSELEFEIGNAEAAPEEQSAPEEVAEPVGVDFIQEHEADAEEDESDNAVSALFDIAEKEDAHTLRDDVFRIKTAYIPTFTGVGDSYNRIGFVREDEVGEGESLTLSVDKPIDAVAELDAEESSDAEIVTVGKREELIEAATTMFKFAEAEETAPEPTVVPEPSVAHEPRDEAEAVASREASAVEVCEEACEREEEREEKTETIVIDEPLAKKTVAPYVPTEISPIERVVGVGDELVEGGHRRSEYSVPASRDRFKDKLLDTLLSQRVRFFVALALSLVLLVFENLPAFGVDWLDLFNMLAIPSALAAIDIQFVTCLLLLAMPEIVRAVRRLCSGGVVSELFLIPTYAVYLAYCLTVILTARTSYSLFGLLFAVFALSAIAAAYCRTSADFRAFKVISAHGDKRIVDNKLTRTLERENLALDGMIDEYRSRTARVFRTSFVADFFARTGRASESVRHLLTLVSIPFGVSLVSGLVSFFVWGDFITPFVLSFMLALPSFSLLVRKLPYLHSSIEATEENGAVIGEAAHFDYAGIDVVCFEDTEIFGSEDVNIQRILLYGNSDNLTKALRQMAALFMNVGGPLAFIFSEALEGRCSPANGVSIKENGISGEIDGKKIMAGSYEYMQSEGVLIPDEEEGDKKSVDATKIMYAAENGVVYAKFYVRYRFSEEFTMLMPQLADEGIIPLVYTRDPNLSNELVKLLSAGTMDIRVLKKTTAPDRDFAPSRISAGMVANGDKSSLVNLLLLSRRYVKFNSGMRMTEYGAMVAGLSLGVLLSLGNMLTLPSGLLALWQIAWCVALWLLSRSFFKLPQKTKENKKDAK